MNELLLLLLTLSVAGAAAGITAGLFGNGGGFVVVPALVFVFSILGDQNPDLIFVAIGTSLATIVVSSARAVRAHQRRGAVDFEVLKTWALWLVLGVFIGLIIASRTNGDRLYAIFAIGVLIYAIYFLFPDRFSNQKTPAPKMPSGLPRASLASFLGGFSALQLGSAPKRAFTISKTHCLRHHLLKGSIWTATSPHCKKNHLHRGGLGEAHLDNNTAGTSWLRSSNIMAFEATTKSLYHPTS